MGCGRIQNRLSAYADGELSLAEVRAVEAHLATCAGCAGTTAYVRQFTRFAAAIPAEEPSADLGARIMARLAELERPKPVAAPWYQRLALPLPKLCFGFAGASMAALALFGLLQLQPGARPRPLAVGADPAALGHASVRPAEREHRDAPPVRTDRLVTAHERNTAPRVEAAEPLQPEPAAQAPVKPLLTVEAAPLPVRARSSVVPAAVREETPPRIGRSQTAPSLDTAVKPEGEPRSAETPAAPAMTMQPLPPSPGEPVVGDGRSEGVMPAMDKDTGGMMMAGAPAEAGTPVQAEGEQSLRMFLEERLRTVPQPPAVETNRGRMRKSL